MKTDSFVLKKIPRITVCVSAGLWFAMPVSANTPESLADVRSMTPVVVVGEALADERIGSEEIQRQQALNMRDIFLLDPAIDVGGGTTSARRLYLNGVEGGNINITIDGARQGRDLHQHRGGIARLDPFLLKRITVQSLGGQGPGALGGSIAFETLDAQDLLDDRTFGARVRAGYSSVDSAEQLGLTAFGRLGGHAGLLAHVSGADRDDYRTGGGRDVEGSASEDRDYFLKLSVLDWEDHELRVSLQRNESAGLYARGSHGSDMGYLPDDPSGPSLPRQQEVQRSSFAVNHRFQPAHSWVDWQTTFYRNENELKYPEDPIQPVSTEENGFSVSNASMWFSGDWSLRTRIGADYLSEKSITQRLDNPGIAYLDGSASRTTSDNFGLFLNGELGWQDLLVSVGARRDSYTAEYGPVTLDGKEISPSYGVRYAVTSELELFASYHEAVRASGIIPAGWLGRIHPGTELQGGGLSAETSVQKETGINYVRRGLIQNGDSAGLNVTYFTTDLEGLIEMPGQGSAPAAWLRNASTVEISGWRARAFWSTPFFSSQLSYSSREVSRDDDPLAVTRRTAAPSGDQFVWDSQWQVSDEWQLGYTLHLVKRLDDVPEGQAERAGYSVHGAQVVYQPSQIHGLTLNLAVHNLFDKDYSDHTSLVSADTGVVAEPGRDVRIGATYVF